MWSGGRQCGSRSTTTAARSSPTTRSRRRRVAPPQGAAIYLAEDDNATSSRSTARDEPTRWPTPAPAPTASSRRCSAAARCGRRLRPRRRRLDPRLRHLGGMEVPLADEDYIDLATDSPDPSRRSGTRCRPATTAVVLQPAAEPEQPVHVRRVRRQHGVDPRGTESAASTAARASRWPSRCRPSR